MARCSKREHTYQRGSQDGGNTFVGDSGGFLHSVSSAGVVTTSGRLDYGTGFTEGPIIDGAAGMVYAFSSSDNTGSAGVFQLSTTFAGGSTGTEVKTGTATAGTTPQYNGAFDHNYIYSSNNTGNLYVCGNPGGKPTLYQIPIATSVMGTPLAGPIRFHDIRSNLLSGDRHLQRHCYRAGPAPGMGVRECARRRLTDGMWWRFLRNELQSDAVAAFVPLQYRPGDSRQQLEHRSSREQWGCIRSNAAGLEHTSIRHDQRRRSSLA